MPRIRYFHILWNNLTVAMYHTRTIYPNLCKMRRSINIVKNSLMWYFCRAILTLLTNSGLFFWKCRYLQMIQWHVNKRLELQTNCNGNFCYSCLFMDIPISQHLQIRYKYVRLHKVSIEFSKNNSKIMHLFRIKENGSSTTIFEM